MCKLKKMSNTKKEGDKGDSGKGEAAAAQPAAEVTEPGNLTTEAAAAGQQPKRKKQPKAVALTLDAAAVGKAGRRPRAAAGAPAQQSGGEHCKPSHSQAWSLFAPFNGPLVLQFESTRVHRQWQVFLLLCLCVCQAWRTHNTLLVDSPTGAPCQSQSPLSDSGPHQLHLTPNGLAALQHPPLNHLMLHQFSNP